MAYLDRGSCVPRSSRPPSVHVARIATTDAEDCAVRLRALGANVRQNQMSGGRFSAEIEAIGLPRLQVGLTTYGPAITSQGTPPEGRYGLALPISRSKQFFFNHHPVGEDEIGLVRPGREFTLLRPAGLQCLIVFPDAALIDRYANAMFGRSLSEMSRTTTLRSDAGAITACARHFAQICSEAVVDQKPLSEWVAACGGPERLVGELIEEIVGILQPPEPIRGWSARSRVINRAWDIVENDDGGVVTVAELCLRLGVPIRTLDDAFRACLGLTPKRFILGVRLNKVRRQLSHPDDATTVTAVATRYGFFHFGHFSDRYACLFGELPSQTLSRCRR